MFIKQNPMGYIDHILNNIEENYKQISDEILRIREDQKNKGFFRRVGDFLSPFTRSKEYDALRNYLNNIDEHFLDWYISLSELEINSLDELYIILRYLETKDNFIKNITNDSESIYSMYKYQGDLKDNIIKIKNEIDNILDLRTLPYYFKQSEE